MLDLEKEHVKWDEWKLYCLAIALGIYSHLVHETEKQEINNFDREVANRKMHALTNQGSLFSVLIILTNSNN